MRRLVTATLVLSLALGSLACGPKGSNPEEKRSFIRSMRSDALKELYETHPESRGKMKNAVGYGVFSNKETKLMFMGTGSGYGVVVNNRSGKETFMKMLKLHGGVGAGIQDLRAIIIFSDAGTLKKFVEEGWQFGGGADIGAVSGEEGAEMTEDIGMDTTLQGMEVYTLTEAGIALSATVASAKFWVDEELN